MLLLLLNKLGLLFLVPYIERVEYSGVYGFLECGFLQLLAVIETQLYVLSMLSGVCQLEICNGPNMQNYPLFCHLFSYR